MEHNANQRKTVKASFHVIVEEKQTGKCTPNFFLAHYQEGNFETSNLETS